MSRLFSESHAYFCRLTESHAYIGGGKVLILWTGGGICFYGLRRNLRRRSYILQLSGLTSSSFTQLMQFNSECYQLLDVILVYPDDTARHSILELLILHSIYPRFYLS